MRNGQNTVVVEVDLVPGATAWPFILSYSTTIIAHGRASWCRPAEHVGADDFGQDVGKPARPLAVAWGHDVQPAAVGYGAAVAALRSLMGVKRTWPNTPPCPLMTQSGLRPASHVAVAKLAPAPIKALV